MLDDALGTLDYYLVHRRQRLAQVEDALAQLGVAVPDADDETLPRQVVEIVYQDVDESLWGAAEWSVRAQLAYLAAPVASRTSVRPNPAQSRRVGLVSRSRQQSRSRRNCADSCACG